MNQDRKKVKLSVAVAFDVSLQDGTESDGQVTLSEGSASLAFVAQDIEEDLFAENGAMFMQKLAQVLHSCIEPMALECQNRTESLQGGRPYIPEVKIYTTKDLARS